MTELIKFLRDRLDEDEQAARAATPGPWSVDNEFYPEAIYADDGTVIGGSRWGGEASIFSQDEDASHIARHDPTRVLADVQAKRAILDAYPVRKVISDSDVPGELWQTAGEIYHYSDGAEWADPWRRSVDPDGAQRVVDAISEYAKDDVRVVLKFLALPYADHPDYREEWRP